MECQKILWNWCGTDWKITRNGFESVLSQSSLDNAMEICSAIENDFDIDKVGMSNESGKIQPEGWVTYRIEMLNCWDVSSGVSSILWTGAPLGGLGTEVLQ